MCGNIENYINGKLAELEKGKDLQDALSNGRLSFGIDSDTYGHLPAWQGLVAQKKKLRRWIWLDAFLLSVTVVVMTKDVFEMFAKSWLTALLAILTLSAMIMLFFVVGAYYSLFIRFRRAEREVRKLIYQDILHQLKKEKETA